MRKHIEKNYAGDRRTRSAFLLFPKTVNQDRRWLEIGEWQEELQYKQNVPDPIWVEIRWMDQPDVESQFMTFHKKAYPPPPPPALKMPKAGWDLKEYNNIRSESDKDLMQAKLEEETEIRIQKREADIVVDMRMEMDRNRPYVSQTPQFKRMMEGQTAEVSAFQGVSILIQHEEGCTIGTTHICNCAAKRSIGNLPAADLEAMQAKASDPELPRPSAIHIDPSRIGDLEKFHLPENHAFRAVYRTLTPVEAALSRAIKDQAYQLKKLIDMTPTGWDQRLAVFALEDSIMRAVRAITQ